MTTMTCRDGAAILADYLEGVLPEDLRIAVDEHVAGCPRCVAFVRAYRETPRIVRDATSFAIPDELVRSLQRFLEGRRRN